MFDIEMMPAREGDCLWIRYGTKKKVHQILIDGGRAATYRTLKARLAALPDDQRAFELFVITHVDRDHIEGALSILEDKSLDITFDQIWFNGYDHLKSVEVETFGALQGERLTTALLKRKQSWNKAFKGKAVSVGDQGKLPKIKLAGGMTLTLLSPDNKKLSELVPTWQKECKAAGLVPGSKARRADARGVESFGSLSSVDKLAASKFSPDSTKPNGSSIALLAEYSGRRIVLAADAHVDRLLPSLRSLSKSKRLQVDAFKVSHHGSDGNVSRELLELLDCPNYLVSTSGSYFQHPRATSIARILKFGGKDKTLHFNYGSKFTRLWDNETLRKQFGYQTEYPKTKADDGNLVVSL